MRISDWSSDVCSSDLPQRQADPDQVGPGAVRPRASGHAPGTHFPFQAARHRQPRTPARRLSPFSSSPSMRPNLLSFALCLALPGMALAHGESSAVEAAPRSDEHTSELQSLMRISYAVFCLKKKKNNTTNNH